MSIKIPNRIKKDFNKGFDEYLNVMGREIQVYLEPYTVDCPNCLIASVHDSSANIYNQAFKRPVTIFPGTLVSKIVYPVPFNVMTVSGVQYDPSILDPKILTVTICPVCKGEGKLISPKEIFIKGLVTWNPKEENMDLSGGWDGKSVCRIKTFDDNYAIVREAKYFIVDGVKCEHHKEGGTPRLKGLGGDHIAEFYLITTSIDKSVSDKYNSDNRLNYNPIERVSDQAPPTTPTIPPIVPGEDRW